MHATGAGAEPAERSPIGLWAVLAVVAAATLLYLLFFRGFASPDGTKSELVGRKMPFLQLEPLTGDPQPVSIDDLAGRVTVINFWGTWCPPCRREFPEIVALAKQFSSHEDFRLYAVSCGNEGDDSDLTNLRSETDGFLRAHQTSLPTFADRKGETRRAMLYGLDLQEGFFYPTTVVLDRQGVIRGFWPGFAENAASEMEKLVTSLLAPATADRPADAAVR